MAAPAGPWRKLHLAIDAVSGEIVANTLTDNGADDVGEVPGLLGQIEGEITSFIADGAYEIDGYLRSQSARLVNYAERYRADLRVGTSVTEGTANFLVNRRMNKSQQMRWSRRGADLLLQVRCALYNGALCERFGHLFEATLSSSLPLAKVA